MWNKGLSYRERHGLIEKNMNTKLNDDVNSTIDKAEYNNSLGLVSVSYTHLTLPTILLV